jgi:hypothetical protein
VTPGVFFTSPLTNVVMLMVCTVSHNQGRNTIHFSVHVTHFPWDTLGSWVASVVSLSVKYPETAQVALKSRGWCATQPRGGCDELWG